MPTRSSISRYRTIFVLGVHHILGSGAKYIVTWMITTLVLAGITMALYTEAYRASPQTLPIAAAVWSLAIATYLRLTWRHLTGMVSDDVRSGDIANRMRYPFPYFGYLIADHIGNAVPTLITIPFLALMAYLAGGLPSIPSPEIAIPIALVMMVGSYALSAMTYIIMGLFAFWMEDPMPVLRIVEKVAVIIGGSVVPLALLPDAARQIFEVIPLAATGFPAQVVNPDFLAHAPRLLAVEFGWIAVMFVALTVMWKRAQRRIEVNGG